MPNTNSEAEEKLRKLGQRAREGFVKEHPVPDKSLETVREAVREQWEQEQKAKRETKAPPEPAKEQQRQPPEPER